MKSKQMQRSSLLGSAGPVLAWAQLPVPQIWSRLWAKVSGFSSRPSWLFSSVQLWSTVQPTADKTKSQVQRKLMMWNVSVQQVTEYPVWQSFFHHCDKIIKLKKDRFLLFHFRGFRPSSHLAPLPLGPVMRQHKGHVMEYRFSPHLMAAIKQREKQGGARDSTSPSKA